MISFPEHIRILQLLFDGGLLVLIWMVQLIVYPSFRYYSKADLVSWHEVYTGRISIVVIPLMFGQLFLAIFQLVRSVDVFTLTNMVLVLFVWISTFAQFVPMHRALSNGNTDDVLLQRLIRYNWLRTFLWSFIFIWNTVVLLL